MSIMSIVCSEGFSCFMFWIKLCVSSWSSTLTCLYGARLMRNLGTCVWRLSWTYKYYLFRCLLGCAWPAFGVRASRSSTDEFFKKENILNKTIVHLIDDIFWNMPFKTPTQADWLSGWQGDYVDYFHYANYAYYGDCLWLCVLCWSCALW